MDVRGLIAVGLSVVIILGFVFLVVDNKRQQRRDALARASARAAEKTQKELLTNLSDEDYAFLVANGWAPPESGHTTWIDTEKV